MRTFHAGAGRVHALAYSPDSRSLVVDLRPAETDHPTPALHRRPATELIWWSWAEGVPSRRFQLTDSLCGPGGALSDEEREHFGEGERALDASFCFDPWRIATVW